MRMYRFDAATGRQITHFDSNFVMARLLRIAPGAQMMGGILISCMHIGAGGIVGYHQAMEPQLFAVVAGAGWVAAADRVRQPIRPFQAAFWQGGEWHESGSDTGMTVIVIEGEGIDPALFMPGR